MATSNRSREETIKANGLQFHYQEWGDVRTKHALILLHGFAETKRIWEEVGQELAREYRVIALDQRGHGSSASAPDNDYSRATQVEDLEAVITTLGLRTVTLVGHAMGGANAICYAAEHPDVVTALVIIETAPEVLRTGMERLRKLTSGPSEFTSLDEVMDLYRESYPESNTEQLERRVRGSIVATDDGAYTWAFDRAFRDSRMRPPEPDPGQRRLNDLWDCVDRVQCPVMIVRGAETDMLTPEAIQRVQRRIIGSRVSLIEGAGHWVPTDQPSSLSLNIREFLQNLSSGPA
ncbi:MAG: alpha/beta hydrolase [Dehalococcoidia bacterium]